MGRRRATTRSTASPWRVEILLGLLGADVVSFHTVSFHTEAYRKELRTGVPARLAPLSLVVARSSRSGDRLIVSCDGGNYRGIAHEVKVLSTERLALVRRDPADHG